MPDTAITFTLKRRPWYKRIWLIPKLWLNNYRILREYGGVLRSAYYGFRLALVLLPESIMIGGKEYPLWL